MRDAAPPGEPLSGATRALVALSAALSAGDAAALGVAMDGAARAATRRQVEEALLQSYLFLGYPAAMRALGAWRARGHAPSTRAPGVVDADAAEAGEPASDDRAAWRARGEAVCARVYGGAYPRLRENVARLHPDLERWMLEEGYGKVLGRPGLALVDRELCIVALLAGLDAPRQLHSHLRGALNVGASPAQVERALEAAAAYLPDGRNRAAGELWRAVRARWAERRSG
jgi:4-carboxymuconolactone decarboxylase